MIKIIGIDGSPRKDSVTARLVEIVLEEAEKAGAETEKMKLIEYEIPPCMGCVSYQGTCNLDECLKQQGQGVVPLLRRLVEADGIVFGSPVYWFGPSGHMKNLIDRMTCLEHEKKLLDGKVAGLVFNYEDEGASMAISEMFLTLSDMGFLFPPYGYTYNNGRNIEELTEFYARQMGRNMVRLAELSKDKRWWQK
jgi:multimeric flavodoxin WrbA